MKKEELIALGLTEEIAAKVEATSLEELKGYIPKARFDEVNTENKQLKDSVKERDGQLETLKNTAGAVDALKQQITELQNANQQKDKDHTAEMKRVRRESLDERLLMESGAINALAVKPFLIAIAEGVDDEGYTALRKQHIEALIQSDSTKFLFKAADGQQNPTFTGIKPGETGTSQPLNGVINPFAKDTYDEAAQIKLFRDNPELAKTLAKQAGLTFYN